LKVTNIVELIHIRIPTKLDKSFGMEEWKEVAFRNGHFATDERGDVTQDNRKNDEKTNALLQFTGTGFTDLIIQRL
jgi:hypothetical protein